MNTKGSEWRGKEVGEGWDIGKTYPKPAPRPKIKNNNASGKNGPAPLFPIAPGLLSSFNAKITNIKIVLAMNSLKNILAFVKNACGYVQKIPAVAVLLGGTVLISCPSYSFIAFT
jgi:hypothetical protein